MANLIIKSSADNLVLQGSDASPAITVGATGTTTFAEPATISGTLGVTGNTTLSGTANNLGTVTAGSIAGGTITSATTFPAGHILQVKGTNANGNWGPISHANEFHLPNQDVTITTKGLNSNYFIVGRFNCDDTNSSTFGCGMSFGHLIGSTLTMLFTAHAHENYTTYAGDKYMVASHQHYFSITTAIGTSITFKSYGRFSGSNGSHANNTGCMGQSTSIMEIQS